jgi:vancomycin resistance protein YoaR
VFFSGLPVVERKNHSQYISSYPKERDATVSWGGPDFKFKNDTDHWILVATSYSNSSVTISLYGTDPGYEVTYKTGDWTEVIAPPVREVKDATLPAGTKVIDERGVSGRTIVVTRTVTKGGSVVRTDTFKSVYRPVEEVVRVGTKPVPSETTITPAP